MCPQSSDFFREIFKFLPILILHELSSHCKNIFLLIDQCFQVKEDGLVPQVVKDSLVVLEQLDPLVPLVLKVNVVFRVAMVCLAHQAFWVHPAYLVTVDPQAFQEVLVFKVHLDLQVRLAYVEQQVQVFFLFAVFSFIVNFFYFVLNLMPDRMTY